MSPKAISNNKRIAKNTMYMYFRMIIVVVISLYMSRIVLNKLGADDYGIYGSVTSVVAILLFLNGTLSSGTSRFIAFELAGDNKQKLKDTFNTTLCIHFFLAVIIIFVMETIGIWFLNNRLVIPDERLYAANIVFQLSIIISFFSITQIPYTSCILAHEDMSVYAYVSILDAILKLIVAFLISISPHDKLVSYAVLMAIEQIIISLLYRRFAIANYEEAKLNYTFNRKISKKLLNFTSWNLLANISQSFKIQGTSIILNMFFTPAIVAAQSIASQVAAQTMQLYNNFKTAIDPQIVKLYAAGEYEQSHNLVLKSTVYVFDLCLLIGIPLFLLMDYIMEIWLVEVPPYAVAFSRLLIIQNIIDSIQNMFYSSLVASGKLKVNSVLGFIIVTLALIILLVVYKCGGNVLWVQYIYIVVAFIQSFIVRPLILVKEVQYNLRDLYTTIFTCVKVAGLSVLLIVPVMVFKCDLYGYNFVILVVSVLSVILSSYVFLDREAKLYINKIIKEKLSLI